MGISCACMPSAAYTCRHHLPSYKAFKSSFLSRLRSFKSSSKLPLSSTRSNVTTEKSSAEPKPHESLRSKPMYPDVPGLLQGETVITFISGGRFGQELEQYGPRGGADSHGRVSLSSETNSYAQHGRREWRGI